MYTVQRMFTNHPDGGRSCVGAIISLLDVIHAVELIPKYGVAANRNVTLETCLASAKQPFLTTDTTVHTPCVQICTVCTDSTNSAQPVQTQPALYKFL